MNWIVCQIGAREHYAVPRALQGAKQLHALVTDAWVKPGSIFHRVIGLQPLCDRYHPDLTQAPIKAFTQSLLQFEITHRLQKTAPWPFMMARNSWFQKYAIMYLDSLNLDDGPATTLFSYSYAASELMRYGKKRRWRTVLGQIDPGIFEEKIVAEEYRQYSKLAPDWQPVPSAYWHSWQKECELADTIIVNSTWSQHLLEKAGVNSKKIRIIPLVYTPSPTAQNFERQYPSAFSTERPLRVLFLGRVTLRKGIAKLIEAIKQLEGKPIEFWIVGIQEIKIPQALLNHPQVKWVGQVPRSQAATYYRQADVFLFPTLSDGYGLTQLEAQAWHLPIIASQNCGQVVENNVNGIVLSTTSAAEIADALQSLYQNPEQLSAFASQTKQSQPFNLKMLQKALLSKATS